MIPECSHAMMFLRNRNGKGIRLGKSWLTELQIEINEILELSNQCPYYQTNEHSWAAWRSFLWQQETFFSLWLVRFKQTTSDLITGSWSIYLRTIRLNRFSLFSEDPGLLEYLGWICKIFLLEYLEFEIELVSGQPLVSHLKNQLCFNTFPKDVKHK